MIRSITQKKSETEIERLLKGLNRIFIIGCGTCVLICPTGKIKLDDITSDHSRHRLNGTPQPFTCQLCADEYQIRANGAGG